MNDGNLRNFRELLEKAKSLQQWMWCIDFCSSYQNRLNAALKFKIDLQNFLMIAHRFKCQLGTEYEWLIQKAAMMDKNECECRYEFETHAYDIVKRAFWIISEIEEELMKQPRNAESNEEQ